MQFLVRDTKVSGREPFLISKEGFEGLQRKFGDRYVRYVPVDNVKVEPDIKLTKVPTIQVTPQGVKKSKGQG